MLILTRKVQEKIQIGENITITVLKVQGRTVRIGIEAPRNLRVIRAEIPVAPEPGTDATLTATSISETAETDSPNSPRPIVIGRRFRVIAPSTPGSSMLQAIPIQ